MSVPCAASRDRALPPDEVGPFVDRLASSVASFPAGAVAAAKTSVDAALADPVPGLRTPAVESDRRTLQSLLERVQAS